MTDAPDPASDPTSQSPTPLEQPSVLWAAPSPSPAANATKFCSACGAEIDARAEICPTCGVRQPVYGQGSGKSRAVAALLALLLGGIGIHKFYLGKTVLGVIYLVFFWTGIPGLIAWVEGMRYLATSDESWAHREVERSRDRLPVDRRSASAAIGPCIHRSHLPWISDW
jgi:Predicted membrane protein